MIRGAEIERVELLPDREEVALAHMRQHEVLLVRDADFRLAELVHQIGERIHLIGRAVARRLSDGLQ